MAEVKENLEEKSEKSYTYHYKFNHEYQTSEPFDVYKVMLLHKKLRNSVGWKPSYRAGMLTKDGQIIQWNKDVEREEREPCHTCHGDVCHRHIKVSEDELAEFSNLKVERLDLNYTSLFNLLFMNPKSLFNKIFGYNENRGATLEMHVYPSKPEESKNKGAYTIQVGASKKKYLEHAKKCLGDMNICP